MTSSHLHRYQRIFETGEVIKEYCDICKKVLITRKSRSGNIDSEKWAKEHEVDYIQKNDKRFKKYYG